MKKMIPQKRGEASHSAAEHHDLPVYSHTDDTVIPYSQVAMVAPTMGMAFLGTCWMTAIRCNMADKVLHLLLKVSAAIQEPLARKKD
ncbi:MAG TPA: hypothetical protein PKK10_11800 [Woeseiaceae bacterium]|nr:hypothetical protein [Woeseiaceae bacterium]